MKKIIHTPKINEITIIAKITVDECLEHGGFIDDPDFIDNISIYKDEMESELMHLFGLNPHPFTTRVSKYNRLGYYD